ncbi:MAG: FHA domain-containing protein [Gemmataceae bacterium]|nr:FHA domain-containing protein [Gemmataceae bacterium]
MARLIPVDGGDPVELTRDVSVVGRKDGCDVRIDNKSISKQHCVLVKTDNLLLIRDLGSTNGTRVNGTRVRRAALVPGDVVAFAAAKYRVELGRGQTVSGHEPTQQLRREDLDELIDGPDPEPTGPRVEVHTHDLPDVYPDEPSSE